MAIQIDINKKVRLEMLLKAMHVSDLNIILFRNDPEVLFQLYLGFYLGKPTFIICLDELVEEVRLHTKHSLVKGVLIVKKYDKEGLRDVMKKISEMAKKEKIL